MIVELENERLRLQGSLDSAKTQRERNILGQFATPSPLAREILEFAKSLPGTRRRIRFLDPAFGTGAFYSALLATFPPSVIARAQGFEIDPHYLEAAADLWRGTPLELKLADFTRLPFPSDEAQKATLVVCNPPYIRHHHIGAKDKLRLHSLTKEASGMSLSGLAGLYCHFMGLAHAWLAPDGYALWLVPSEFMDVNYGTPVKDYLTARVRLLRIHRFDPSDCQFPDALVSSAVVVFQNAKSSPDHAADFSYGGSLAKPQRVTRVDLSALQRVPKWTRVGVRATSTAGPNGGLRIGDLFSIRRGIATGDNGFFVLTRDQAASLCLSPQVLRPILPSPRYLNSDEIEADPEGWPILDKPRVLVDCTLPEAEVQAHYPGLWKYFESGKAKAVHTGYLCRNRSPWYCQERRPPAPILCTYMGRKESSRGAFRFILNHSWATATNVYLLLYPKPALAAALRRDPQAVRKVWDALRSINMESLIGAGRVYGGGLHKLEPKELANAPAECIRCALPGLAVPARHRQGTLFE